MSAARGVKNFIRQLLWKLCRRDFLVLNPAWTVANREANFALVGSGTLCAQRYLPVRYNYHTPAAWRLDYQLRGCGAGQLRYQLSAPGTPPFCDFSQQIRLPARIIVTLTPTGLAINGAPLALIPGGTLPRDTTALTAQLSFASDQGEVLSRNAGHRVQLENAPQDENYFRGLVYHDYDSQAAMVPGQIWRAIGRFRELKGRLLDIGCATGLLVESALVRGLEADGIDCSAWAVNQANARTAGRCRVLDFDRATRGDFSESYDIVVLHSVLEHLAEPKRALELLFQITHPGSVVYIQTLNADSLLHKILGPDWSGYSDYTHRSPWITADWLSEQAVAAGFTPLNVKRYGAWNDNQYDEAWRSLTSLIQTHPAGLVLEDQFGDFIEAVLGHGDVNVGSREAEDAVQGFRRRVRASRR